MLTNSVDSYAIIILQEIDVLNLSFIHEFSNF